MIHPPPPLFQVGPIVSSTGVCTTYFTLALITEIYPFMASSSYVWLVYASFSVACLVMALVAWLFMPVTLGKSQEEIRDFFQNSRTIKF